jgi:uncharacterized membrane protein
MNLPSLDELNFSNWEIIFASFAGSLIELVEILGIALVVGRLAGWQNALVGASSGMGLTLIVSLVLGKSLLLIPTQILKILAGGFLLLFGQGWTRSVVRYYGGLPKRKKAKKDDDERLEEQLEQEGAQSGWNWLAIVTTFKSAVLESVEVAIAVVTLGAASQAWPEAIAGSGASFIGLAVFAALLRAPLKRIPVKVMKFVAAMLLMGFGTYWLGAGLNIHWPTGELAIVWIPLVWGALMTSTALFLRLTVSTQKPQEITRLQ